MVGPFFGAILGACFRCCWHGWMQTCSPFSRRSYTLLAHAKCMRNGSSRFGTHGYRCISFGFFRGFETIESLQVGSCRVFRVRGCDCALELFVGHARRNMTTWVHLRVLTANRAWIYTRAGGTSQKQQQQNDDLVRKVSVNTREERELRTTVAACFRLRSFGRWFCWLPGLGRAPCGAAYGGAVLAPLAVLPTAEVAGRT